MVESSRDRIFGIERLRFRRVSQDRKTRSSAQGKDIIQMQTFIDHQSPSHKSGAPSPPPGKSRRAKSKDAEEIGIPCDIPSAPLPLSPTQDGTPGLLVDGQAEAGEEKEMLAVTAAPR